MKPAAVLLVAAAAWAQVPVETVALGTTAERPAVSPAVMTDLEKQLDKRVSMVGANDPIQLLGLARGVYVKGFAVVITQEISLVQKPFPNPFRQSITPFEAAQIHKRRAPASGTADGSPVVDGRGGSAEHYPGQRSDRGGRTASLSRMGGHQGSSGAVGRESHTPRWLNRQSPDGRTISDTHAPAHPGIPIRERNDKIGKILVDIGSSAQRDVLAAFSDQLGIPLVRVAGPRAGLSRNRGADGACPAPVACVAHGAGGFDAQAAMADTLDFETVGTVHAFSGLQIQTVLAAEPRRQPQTLPIYVGVCPRVPRLRSERASKFVKDQ